MRSVQSLVRRRPRLAAAGRRRWAWQVAALAASGVVIASAAVPAYAAGTELKFFWNQEGRDRSSPRLGLGPSFLLHGLAAPVRPQLVVVGNSGLASVFCTSSTNCWSVGDRDLNHVVHNQALHFNGKKWSLVRTPDPGGTAVKDSSELFGVRCTSKANCWAVGYYDKNGAVLGQALHWNGRKWSLAATPNPGGTKLDDFNQLTDVMCASAVNCWADGDYGSAAGVSEVALNLVLHWNGTAWSQVATPNPGGVAPTDINQVSAIRCTSVASCWGVGLFGTLVSGVLTVGNEVLHWNGTKWFNVAVPSPGQSDMGNVASALTYLSCTSRQSCWAVGTDTGTARFRNQTMHWNGKKWRLVAAPSPANGANAGNGLDGVSCTSARNCWAVGDFGNPFSGGAIKNQVLHWTGRKWFFVAVPEPAGTATNAINTLLGDRCVSATNCWAVGGTARPGKPRVNEILHWTGKKWFVAG